MNVIELEDKEYKKVILILDLLIIFQELQESWLSPTGAKVFLPTMLQGVATKEDAPLAFDIKPLLTPRTSTAIVEVKEWKLEEVHWDALLAQNGKDVMIPPEIAANSLVKEETKSS